MGYSLLGGTCDIQEKLRLICRREEPRQMPYERRMSRASTRSACVAACWPVGPFQSNTMFMLATDDTGHSGATLLDNKRRYLYTWYSRTISIIVDVWLRNSCRREKKYENQRSDS